MGGLIALIILLIVAFVMAKVLFGVALALVIPILFWMFTGYLTGQVMRGRGYGVFGNIALGLLGGITGTLVLSALGLAGIGQVPIIGSIIVGVFGAIVLIFLMRLIDPNFGKSA